MSRIPYPWHGIEAVSKEQRVSVKVWGREAVQDRTLFPVSLKTQNTELLASPIRLTGKANGKPVQWEDEGCYLLEPTVKRAVVNGYAQSECLIANSTMEWAYDGGVRWDVKIMPRGLTVPQVFGLEPCRIPGWELQQLALEIPLRKEAVSLYISWPAGGVRSLKSGEELAENGRIPAGGISMPFKPGIWLGNEKAGIQLVCESDELWQPAGEAIEIADGGDHWLLRLHLLDEAPRSWKDPGEASPHLNYCLGMIMTPVKPVDPAFNKLHAVHIDCFAKIEGDYWPFLNAPVSEEVPRPVIDRLCDAGINLLVLHEKWTRIQNYWEYAVETREEITKLVRLCHERGIRVIPYFGYEISSPMPEFAKVQRNVTWMDADSPGCRSMWYRVPYQRAHKICYQSEWQDRLVEGVLKCIDDFEFDGVYLDSTTAPWGCGNQTHGCGYVDAEGKLRPTYPVFALRNMMQRICEGVHERHGLVNPHPSGATFPFITAGADMLWDGEHIQTAIWKQGVKGFSLDYFRAEYIGRNLGIPVQFIIYEAPGWTFDMALSLCLIHGVYPRPNSVLHPLDVMEKIWKITDRYNISDASFRGYWEQDGLVTASAGKVSYYIRLENNGGLRILILAANPSSDNLKDAVIRISPEAVGRKRVETLWNAWEERVEAADDGFIHVDLPPYHFAIYEAVLK